MRKMYVVREGIVIRTCRICGISNQELKFGRRRLQSGKPTKEWHYQNICIMCQREDNQLSYEKNRKKIIAKMCYANSWQKKFKEKYNAMRRKKYAKQQRMEERDETYNYSSEY